MRSLDLALLRALRGHRGPEPFERAVLLFTRAGEHGLLWHLVLLLAAAGCAEQRGQLLRGMRTVFVAYLLNIGLKYVVRRKRPVLEGLPPLSTTVTSLSFPSAHSTTSFAAARALVHVGVPASPAYAVAVAMALSRIYVGVHYPTDIAAGAALGTAVAELIDR